jgi:hypothetical protein
MLLFALVGVMLQLPLPPRSSCQRCSVVSPNPS